MYTNKEYNNIDIKLNSREILQFIEVLKCADAYMDTYGIRKGRKLLDNLLEEMKKYK